MHCNIFAFAMRIIIGKWDGQSVSTEDKAEIRLHVLCCAVLDWTVGNEEIIWRPKDEEEDCNEVMQK